MQLYNTLSRKIEEFVPINPPKVGIYTCGPTVYDYQHIGNFRTMTLSDILFRVLEYNDFEVKSVRNVTDIDDKIIKGASLKSLPIQEYSAEFTRIFFEDLQKLNILPVDITTYATSYVPKMIVYIEDLVAKGFAYVESDGSVYFSIGKFANYGRLSGVERKDLKTGTRVLSDEYDKDNIQDFALWKSVRPDEREGYDSPWGRGRPGWHIECSVMSQDNLGDSFDIHAGGVDLIFPHHENEIAQSEARTGKPFVKYWVHGEFLNVDGGKMSKSRQNFYTLRDIETKGFDPLALRYFYLTAHYRTVLNFTWEALKNAQNSLEKLRNKIRALQRPLQGSTLQMAAGSAENERNFLEAINNDLNMPKALAVAWKTESYESLMKIDRVLGLKLGEVPVEKEVPADVKRMLSQREELRKAGEYAEADKIRDEIVKKGYTVNDEPA